MSYQVTAPLVHVKVPDILGIGRRGGYITVIAYRGAILAQDAHPESIAYLLDQGMIADTNPKPAARSKA